MRLYNREQTQLNINMEVEVVRNENERWLEEYLDRHQPALVNSRITLSLDTLRDQNPKCVQAIIQTPVLYHKLVKDWHKLRVEAESGKKLTSIAKEDPFRVSFEGNLGSNFVTPRGLGSKMANQLAGIQGIVTRISIARFQLHKSVHWCEKTSASSHKDYADEFAPDEEFDLKKNKTIPNTDTNSNPLEFEFGRSTFKNFQTAVIQELPEMAPAGQLPRSVNVVLQDDLVDKVKPGDRVQMIGIFRLQPGNQTRENGILKTLFICTSVFPLLQQPSPLTTNKLKFTVPYPEDKLLDLFSQSISPSIYGHEYLKKAVLLMLLGGCEKVLDNGAHLRGDINLLMIGDPGTAKSQMLRWVLSTVDVGINTTGSGASGVGLTAAITMDKDTGERNIEAGAMVLADRGFVCIDQFDKMDEVDRVAVHEVMEQQTVTIAKAGIHCSLNARCSVIAAANPIYGEYQKDLPPTRNIGMPDSLLSRFDLIFIILDERDADKDRKVAERVCKNHRYANVELIHDNNVEDDYVIQPTEQRSSKSEEMIFEKSALFKGENKTEILTQAYLKRYINHCRKNIEPVLTDEAIELLANLWSCVREKELTQKETMGTKVLPVTIRSYETLIRLSTAHAKLRLSLEVEISDCVEAFKLMVYCLYKDENALDRELKDAIRSVMGDEFDKKHRTSKKTKIVQEINSSEKRKSHKKEESDITSRLQKIDIGKEEEEVERALYSGLSVKEKKKVSSSVFQVFSKMIENKRDEKVTLKQLMKQLPEMEEADLKQVLRELDANQKLLFDEEKGNVHSV